MARRTGLTRDEIYSTALTLGSALVSEHGLEKFSMREVARQIGYTVGTLYNVFKNQDDFLLTINSLTLEELYQFIKNNIDENLQGKDILHRIAISYYTFAKVNYKRWKVLFEYNLKENSTLPEWYMEKIALLVKFAEHSLSTMNLSKIEIQRASRTLWAGVHGICILSLSGKLTLTKSDLAEDLIRELIDKYFTGLTFNQ